MFLVAAPRDGSNLIPVVRIDLRIEWASARVPMASDTLLKYWDVMPDGTFVVASRWGEYSVECNRPDATLLRTLEVLDQPSRLLRRDMAEWLANRATQTMSAAFEREIEALPAEFDRQIQGIVPRENGDLWVLPASGLQEHASKAFATYDVWASARELSHRVTLNSPMAVHRYRDAWFVRGDWVFVVLGGGEALLQHNVGAPEAAEVFDFEPIDEAEYMTVIEMRMDSAKAPDPAPGPSRN